MRRAEPCPIPGCLAFKARGSIMCARHWRMVSSFTRDVINRAWRHLRVAKQDGDASGFREWAHTFVSYRKVAIGEVCEAEGILVTDR